MKKLILIITGLILTFAITGCTRVSSTSNVGNKVSEIVSDSAETESGMEKLTEEHTTEASTEKPNVENKESEYNAEVAEKKFKEADIPDSIKNIFLSDGEFIDTQTQREMKLPDYKLYEIIYSHDEANADIYTEVYDLEKYKRVFEWISYIAVDYDGDGKNELFYAVNGGTGGVIFHEHTDGKVYAYGHQSLRIHIGENGDVVGSFGADFTAHVLERYSFDTEKIIKTDIAFAKQQDDGEYKYYAEGREVDLAEFETYFHLLSEGSLRWTEFRITFGFEENQTSGN